MKQAEKRLHNGVLCLQCIRYLLERELHTLDIISAAFEGRARPSVAASH